jgi:N-acetyl-1-D-myo-inositol-2-amino-2-deoxy-alpha-D-glucopyranoside deacetylase
MSKQRTLVFFGAHPDDESFGVGATLAQYAAAGVKVYCVCSTGGEAGTVSPEHMRGYDTIAELRAAELSCAVKALDLAGLIYLGYRDSGMRGSEENKHPNCLAAAPLEEVIGRMVKIIREIRPDVVITHDPSTDYGHPDHIATHKATLQAFRAAGEPSQYPANGPAFQPGKLYFGVRPHGTMRIMVKLMPLFGHNPRHFGRNKDIDLTRMVGVDYPIHAIIRLSRQAVETRQRAAACHASQGGGRFRAGPFRILRIVEKLRGPRDYFTRVYPLPAPRRPARDLFNGT